MGISKTFRVISGVLILDKCWVTVWSLINNVRCLLFTRLSKGNVLELQSFLFQLCAADLIELNIKKLCCFAS